MVLRSDSVRRSIGTHEMSRLENRGKVEMLSFGCPQDLIDYEHLGSTDHLVNGPESQLGHDLSKLLDDVVEEVDNLFGLTSELGAKSGILSGDTNGASVPAKVSLNSIRGFQDSLVASLHHDTAHSDQRGGSETPFFRTEQRRDSHIPSGPDLTVGLNSNSPSKIVEHEGLMGLG